MSYVVLARKYRPRSFEQMVGQEHVVRALSNALEQGRLHHAYLFTGTRGIGKTTVSRILAKSLNCTGIDGSGGITAHPCGVCSACTQIDADRYIDYIELDAASNRGIAEVQDLIERAAYKPGIGRFKVFMIDEAHQLTPAAFNALLKTLEEPPEYLKFVLATTDPEKILPTVLSRCLQFNLRPMAPEVVQAHLETVLAAEGVAADAGSLRLLSRAARGSMRDALSLTDQAIAYGGGALDVAVVRAMLGAVDRDQAGAMVEALARRDGPALLERIAVLRSQGFSAAATLEEIAALLQQMAVEQAVPGTLDLADPALAEAARLAHMLPPDETQLLYSIVLHGRSELSLMSDEYGALTMVLLRLFAFAPAATAVTGAKPGPVSDARLPPASAAQAVSPPTRSTAVSSPLRASAAPAIQVPVAAESARPAAAPLARRVPAPEPASASSLAMLNEREPSPYGGRASAAPALAPATSPPVAADSPAPARVADPGVDTVLADRWQALTTRLADRGSIAALTREMAWQAGLLRIDDSAEPPVWHLCVERDSLRTSALGDKLAAALAAELGQPLRIEFQAGAPTDTPARREAAERARRQAEAERSIRGDPLVQELLSQFKGARIVPGSIKPVPL